MSNHSSDRVGCECINTRLGKIKTSGGIKFVFILEFDIPGNTTPLIKFFNCNSKTEGSYTIKHNSDLAKLYRTTIGAIDKKRLSKAHQLLAHFHGYKFHISFVPALSKNEQPYLKVTEISPVIIIESDDWTANGTLKKTKKKHRPTSPKIGDNVEKSRRQTGENQETNRRKSGDDKTLEAANSLGLAPVFNPTKKHNIQGGATHPYNTQNNCKIFKYQQHNDESLDEFYDRVIDESFVNMGWS